MGPKLRKFQFNSYKWTTIKKKQPLKKQDNRSTKIYKVVCFFLIRFHREVQIFEDFRNLWATSILETYRGTRAIIFLRST